MIQPQNDLPGFENPDENNQEIEDESYKVKTFKKGGGFQCMGLSFNILKGINKRGYKIPTPIQRKTIPLVLEGRDVVAMARTGSGKTACFLIPLFEKLKQRSAKAGARALVLSPTRELALQTLKFIKELGRFVGLKAAVVLGGDSMDDQFSAIHGNPDIIVATPGRFLHVCMEMDLKLNSIEYVVFDEADRLFEMGLEGQLSEIIAKLPESRQTVLFSATLPKVLVEFAKAGLSDPILIRLDVESKLPNELQLEFFAVRPEEKLAALLVLLNAQIDANQQTIVFAATKHHVEYIHLVLDRLGITNTYIYSNLDATARKIHTAKFVNGRCRVLVVTDVAARGIDIPQLDNVINYNFPAKSKMFIHRVGRCARVGRTGTAYSLVTPDEYAYLLDLHMFLDRPLTICTTKDKNGNLGRLPPTLLEEQHSLLLTMHKQFADVTSIQKVSENGYQQYLRSRPLASVESNRRIKELPFSTCVVHPIFHNDDNDADLEAQKELLLDQMKIYRPNGTIFEICGKNKSSEYIAMKQKRLLHKDTIEGHQQLLREKEKTATLIPTKLASMATCDQQDIDDAFTQVVLPKKRRIDSLYKKSSKKFRKDENYIPYVPADKLTEEGLAVNNFQKDANSAGFDLVADSEDVLNKNKQKMKWDRKKKKMVAVEKQNTKKIQTESGKWIPASYKTNRYSQWKEKSKIAHMEDSQEGDSTKSEGFFAANSRPKTHWARHNEKIKLKKTKAELKTSDQILKARQIKERNRRKHNNGRKTKKNQKNKRKK